MVGHAGEEGRRGQLHLLVSRIQKGGRQRRDKTEDLSTLYKEFDDFSLWRCGAIGRGLAWER